MHVHACYSYFLIHAGFYTMNECSNINSQEYKFLGIENIWLWVVRKLLYTCTCKLELFSYLYRILHHQGVLKYKKVSNTKLWIVKNTSPQNSCYNFMSVPAHEHYRCFLYPQGFTPCSCNIFSLSKRIHVTAIVHHEWVLKYKQV